MRQGTTPTIWMKLPDYISCDSISDAIFTIAQRDVAVITKKFSDFTINGKDKILSVRLTQQETLSLNPSHSAQLQLKIEVDGNILVSDITTTTVGKAFNTEVL